MRTILVLLLAALAASPAVLSLAPAAEGGAALAIPARQAGVSTIEVASLAGVTITSLPFFSGEPNVAVGPDGTVYVAGLDWPGSRVFRKLPGGAFQDLGRPNFGFGGADEALAVGPDGTLFVAGMYWGGPSWCASVTRSTTRGASWDPPVPGICRNNRIDRQWIAVDAEGDPWLTAHENCCSGQHLAHRSRDGGVTWKEAGFVTQTGGFPGNLFVDRTRGLIFEATVCDLGRAACLFMASTAVDQPFWVPVARIPIAFGHSGLQHITGAVDEAGNLYLAYVDKLPHDARAGIYVARSVDVGLTWSVPERVSGPDLAVFPWIAAGADGRVGVVWYATPSGTNANFVSPSAEWHVHAAFRTDWLTGSWSTMRVSDTPNHVGVLCTNGFACHAEGRDRDLLDFFEAAVSPDGALHVVWSDDVRWTVRHAEVRAVPLR